MSKDLRERFVELCMILPERYPIDQQYRAKECVAYDLMHGVCIEREIVDPTHKREAAMRMFDEIEAAYAEGHRAYHTMTHIEHVLSEFDRCKGMLHDPTPDGIVARIFIKLLSAFAELQEHAPLQVEMALWLHDLIMKKGSRTNEEDSAIAAREFLFRLGVAENFTVVVEELILATKHMAVPDGELARYLVDIDLAILGQPWQRFKEYDHEIYREYVINANVPIDLYLEKRIEILGTFLGRERIYSTEFFRVRYESQAKANIARIIEELRSLQSDRAHIMCNK